MNKKGFFVDAMFYLIILLVFGIVMMVMYKAGIDIQNKIEPKVNQTTAGQKAISSGTKTIGILGNAFAFLFIGLIGALFVSVWFLRSHPILLIIAVIAIITLTIVAGALSNAYGKVADSIGFENSSGSFAVTNFMMDRLPKFFIFGLAIVIIGLLAKKAFGAK